MALPPSGLREAKICKNKIILMAKFPKKGLHVILDQIGQNSHFQNVDLQKHLCTRQDFRFVKYGVCRENFGYLCYGLILNFFLKKSMWSS